jgi:excisionase family DNA binding protein
MPFANLFSRGVSTVASLIPLEEAAKMLGLSIEDLTELRSRGDIHAYRDGKTWKFKEAEIERYKAMHQNDVTDHATKPGESAILSGSSLEIDADLDEMVDVSDLDEEDDSQEVIDDAEVGIESSSSSTIIGKPKLSKATVGDSEELIEIGQIDADDVAAADSGLELTVGEGSELKLVETDSISPDTVDVSGSDLKLVGESDVSPDDASGTDVGGADVGGSDILLEQSGDEDAAATGELPSIQPDAQGDDILLDQPEIDLENALNLSDEDLELSLGSSSEISLDGSDLALAPSDTGVGVTDESDVTLDASGSGIDLGSPTDSGIALDQTPPEIAVSGEALELGEVEDLVDLGDALLEDDDSLQADDDFLLSPSESDLGEEDSGSQVIALDTEELDDEAATLIGDEGGKFETFEAADEDAELAPIATGAAAADAPFSIWNVLALGSVITMLCLTGVMLLDVVRNMWSWQGEYAINSTLMDFILSMFG